MFNNVFEPDFESEREDWFSLAELENSLPKLINPAHVRTASIEYAMDLCRSVDELSHVEVLEDDEHEWIKITQEEIEILLHYIEMHNRLYRQARQMDPEQFLALEEEYCLDTMCYDSMEELWQHLTN